MERERQATSAQYTDRLRREGADIGEEVLEVGGSETSDGIPALGAGVTVLGDARLSGEVVTRGDILVSVGGSGVEHLVEETERLETTAHTVVVDERDDGTEGRGRAGGTIDLLEGDGGAGVGDTDEVGMSVGRNVGEGTVVLVEVLRRGQVGSRVIQVSSDSRTLPVGTGNVVRETSTSGDESTRVRASNLRSDGGAGEGRAGGLVVGNRGRSSVGIQHGGSDGGDPRRSTREDGRQGRGGGEAVGVSVTRSSLITRRGEERDTESSDLHELVVDTSNIRLGVRARSDLALKRLGPSPGHGDNERRVGGVDEGSGELVHPARNSPEPGLSVQGKSEGILSIESSLSVGVGGRERTDSLGDLSLLADLLIPPGKISRRVGSIILELSNADGGLLGSRDRGGDSVHVTQNGGDDVAGSDVVTLRGLGVHGTADRADGRGLIQLSQTRNEINDVVQVLGGLEGTEVTSHDLAGLNMLESVERATEHTLQERDGGSSNDNIAASGINVTDSSSSQPLHIPETNITKITHRFHSEHPCCRQMKSKPRKRCIAFQIEKFARQIGNCVSVCEQELRSYKIKKSAFKGAQKAEKESISVD